MSARSTLPDQQQWLTAACDLVEPFNFQAATRSLQAIGNEIALLRIQVLRAQMAYFPKAVPQERSSRAINAALREEYWRRNGYWVIDRTDAPASQGRG